MTDLLSDYLHTPLHKPSLKSYHSPFSPLGRTPSSILSSRPFFTQHNSFIRAFGTSYILLIASKPLRLSLCTALIIDLSFSFHIIASLPYMRTGSQCPMQGPSTLKRQIPSINQGPITIATLLPPFRLLHTSLYVICIWSVQNTPKYLHSDTCSICILFTRTSHSILRHLLLHTSTKRPTISYRSFSDSPQKTKSST